MTNNVVRIKRLLSAESSADNLCFAAYAHTHETKLRVPRAMWRRAVADTEGPQTGNVYSLPRKALRLIEAEASCQMAMGNWPVRSVLALR